jgi:GAF domain-containing protein
MVTEASVGDTLHRLSDITLAAMPAARMAGIAMHDERGRAATRIFTDPETTEIDAAQYESDRGPCLDAWRRGEVVRVDDMDDGAATYPEFSAAARDHGILSTLSLPLVAGDRSVGALNLYASERHGFGEDDESVGTDIASAAAVVLTNAAAYWEAFELSEQLNEAMASRATIEQAKGILMAGSSKMTPDEAFQVLRAASQRENVKLREIAQRIVDRRSS